MGFCDLPLADTVCDVSDAVSFVSDPGKAIGNWLATSAGEFAALAVDLAAKAVDTTTDVDLNAPWFRDNYETLLPIGLVVLVATFCAQLVRAAIRRDGQALAQAFTGTAAGVIFSFAAIALTTVAIEVVDALADGLLATAGLNIESAVRRIIKVHEFTAFSGLSWLAMVAIELGAALGAILYWCVMMVRKVGILVMVTLAVFAGAGGGWEAARRWRKGWIEATATLVVSKLLMTVIFVLGIGAMGKTDADDGLSALADVLAGLVVLTLVLLCPYACFKFVHWAAEGSDGESLHRAGGSGAQIARQHAERAGRKAASMVATAGAGSAIAGAGAAPQGPDSVLGASAPGDTAATATGSSQEDASSTNGPGVSPAGAAVKSALEKAVQPPPTTSSPDASTGTSDQTSGTTAPAGMGTASVEGFAGGWRSRAPTTTPPPRAAAPPSTQNADLTGPAAPPSSPAGP